MGCIHYLYSCRYNRILMPNYTLSDDFSCFECGEPVPFESLEDHMIKSHGYIRCPQCDQLFNFCRLDEHNKQYHNKLENGKTMCPECEVLISTHDISDHLKVTHAYISCEVCTQPIKPAGLKDHMLVHDMTICPLCDGFFLVQWLESHLLDIHNKRTCPKCAGLIEIENFNVHIKTMHFYIECEVCGFLESPIKMDLHLREVHNFKPCPRCGILMDEKKLKNHIKNAH